MNYERLTDLLLSYLVNLYGEEGVINMLLQYPYDLTEHDLIQLGFDITEIDID
jgi:hypothetical protein